jgi:transposase InsO family protein
MDIIGPLRKTNGQNKYILVCIDLFTSWIEATPLKSITAQEVIQAFFKIVISRHGCPTKVLTDQGSQFTSTLFLDMCKHFNIVKLESTAYHHQCNGKAERFNRFLENTLTTVIHKDQKNWDNMLDNCLFIYRISLNRSLDDTPFFLMYGRDVVMPQDLMFPYLARNVVTIRHNDVDEFKLDQLKNLKRAYDKLIKQKEKEQESYKLYYDATHKHINFDIGSQVMVYFNTPKTGLSTKLLASWDGPYKVHSKLNDVTYRVEKDNRNFAVHVQRLRQYKPFHSESY